MIRSVQTSIPTRSRPTFQTCSSPEVRSRGGTLARYSSKTAASTGSASFASSLSACGRGRRRNLCRRIFVRYRIALSLLFASLFFVNTASAQNWSFDARKVGMGSPTGGENLASRMIEEENDYRGIVLPFGLIQVFRDFDRLNPSKDEFDLVRTVEYAAAPLHYTIGRATSDTKADDFIIDIGNGELSRELNAYKGF